MSLEPGTVKIMYQYVFMAVVMKQDMRNYITGARMSAIPLNCYKP